MKKTVFALAFLFGALSINAQLVVNQNGKVGINYPSTLSSLSSSLNIGGDNRNFVVNIQPALGNGLNIKTGDGGLNRYGLKISTKLANDTTASSIYILQTQGTSNKSTYGIKSCSGLSTGGSYGVAGGLYGVSQGVTTYGAGIFGSSTSTLVMSNEQHRYAGYFRGDVRVTGTLYGTLLTPSENVSASSPTSSVVQAYSINGEEEGEESVSDKLQQVQLLQFYRSPDENKLSEEEIEAQREALRTARLEAKEVQLEKGASLTEEPDDFEDEIVKEIPQTALSTVRYGLAADQLKEVYPELVYEDKNGNTSINYIEMIPLLVQAVNEVKAENATLKDEIAALKGGKDIRAKARTPETTSIETADEAILSLSQNNPNPFSEQTSIEVSVPESVHAASLYIYDMSGKQIKRIDIMERGITRISVTSEGLTEGMYLYSLIADGKVAGTKKMILTK